MGDYLLLLRNDASAMTDEATFARFVAWSEGLKAKGALRGVERLKLAGGELLRKRSGTVVVDGPFTESKEVVMGYFLIAAESTEAARALAASCPVLDIGGSIELRETDAFPK